MYLRKSIFPLLISSVFATSVAEAALLIGGSGNDLLTGTAVADTLIGNQGNDILNGLGGSDLFIWNDGDGNDVVEGGSGTDTQQFNGSNAAGDDISISANGSRVRIDRNNLDLVTLDVGTTENFDINGQGGSDVIVGSTGLAALGVNLDLDGGAGNDLLIGGDGADVLRGGADNDTLIGSAGNDVMLGESGNDLFIWYNGDGSDLIEGGADNDILQVNSSNSSGDDISITANGSRVRVQRNNLSLFTLDVGTTESLDINGQGGNDFITAGPGLSSLISLDLNGGAGNDQLTGSDGADTLRGGTGADILFGKGGNDILIGGGDSDIFSFDSDGIDLIADFELDDFINVEGLFPIPPIVNPGDDLFSLGFLSQQMMGSNLHVSFLGTDSLFQEIAILNNFSLTLFSTFSNPFMLSAIQQSIPEPGILLLFISGGFLLLRLRKRTR